MDEFLKDLLALLVGALKKGFVSQIQNFLLEQLNKYGCRLLYDVFPSKREFYWKLFSRSFKKVGVEEIKAFFRLQKGKPRLPGFIITTVGYTEDARDFAKKKGILLLTFDELAQHLRFKELPPQEWENYNILFP